jgi:tetratricopeptide (TPR) repeat protein
MTDANEDELQKQINELFEDDKYEQALVLLDRVLEIDPQSAPMHYKKANILQLLGRYEEAINSYDEALNINPNHAPTYYNRGIAFDEMGLANVKI